MDRPVEGDQVEVEFDDAVIAGERFGGEGVEHASVDPLVPPGAQRGVGDLETQDRFDVDPRRTGHQPDQGHAEADLVGTRGR